jgi:peptidoglycan/xylan/chitin deacetylase (PgdA/CDA1 family)
MNRPRSSLSRWRRLILRPAVLWPAGAVALAAATVLALFWFQPRFLVSRLAAHHSEVLFYVDTDSLAVALTIDDVPDADLMPKVLEVLARHDVRATFFVLGEKVPGNEDLIAAMKDAGHELGNHLARDEASILLTDEEFAAQLRGVETMIGPLTEPKWCRPGSGWFTPGMVKVAADEGYRFCLGSVYPYDNKIRHPGLIRGAVLDRIYPGAILVLHGGGPQRAYLVELLDSLLPALKERGFAFLTLTELTELEGP